MTLSRIVEYVFFFGLLVFAGYMVWQIAAPFITALALSAIIVTITHPLHKRILAKTPRQNATLAAFLSTIVVLLVFILPLTLLTSVVVTEIVTVYQDFSVAESGGLQSQIASLESTVETLFPGASLDVVGLAESSVGLIAGNLGTIFAGTVSTLFTFLIAIIGSFYFF